MSEKPIQWYPGHMTKTSRLIDANLGLVDIVVEICDARAAASTRNPLLQRARKGKPHLLILGKADLADSSVTDRWLQALRREGLFVLSGSCKDKKLAAAVLREMDRALETVRERWAARGMVGRAPRAMVVGVPNVGKSTLINKLSGGRRAKVEDRPGVTRGKQWVTLPTGLELLDMPGILWPKFHNQLHARHIAYLGSINDDILDLEEIAASLCEELVALYPGALPARYGIEASPDAAGHALLTAVAQKRGMLMPGGVPDTGRAAITLLDEFRAGRLGRISLDRPGERERP